MEDVFAPVDLEHRGARGSADGGYLDPCGVGGLVLVMVVLEFTAEGAGEFAVSVREEAAKDAEVALRSCFSRGCVESSWFWGRHCFRGLI